jgi:hypothetical protein
MGRIQGGDILLCKMYNGGYYISQFITKVIIYVTWIFNFKNDLYGYEKAKSIKPILF